jgi:hypothetical protein
MGCVGLEYIRTKYPDYLCAAEIKPGYMRETNHHALGNQTTIHVPTRPTIHWLGANSFIAHLHLLFTLTTPVFRPEFMLRARSAGTDSPFHSPNSSTR